MSASSRIKVTSSCFVPADLMRWQQPALSVTPAMVNQVLVQHRHKGKWTAEWSRLDQPGAARGSVWAPAAMVRLIIDIGQCNAK